PCGGFSPAPAASGPTGVSTWPGRFQPPSPMCSSPGVGLVTRPAAACTSPSASTTRSMNGWPPDGQSQAIRVGAVTHYDVVVLGAGPGGTVAARRPAHRGG